MKITTRAQALAAGERTYFTGKPCKNGHISTRYTATSLCHGCANMRQKEIRQKFMMASQGAENIVVKMHPGDRIQVQDFATMLAAARGMVIYGIPDAPGRVSTHTGPAPKTPTTINYIPAEMRSIIDGAVNS